MVTAPHWYIVFIPIAIGLLSAGQTIHTKQGPDFLDTLKTGWGLSYWMSRGLIPGGTYVAWFFATQPSQDSYWAALACGFGSEAVLRAKLFVGQQKSQDIYKGLFDLIEWWQGIFIAKAAVVLAQQKINFIKKAISNETDFPTFAECVNQNAQALDREKDVRQTVDKLLQIFQTEISKTPAGDSNIQVHKRYIRELSHDLLDLVGRDGFKVLTTV